MKRLLAILLTLVLCLGVFVSCDNSEETSSSESSLLNSEVPIEDLQTSSESQSEPEAMSTAQLRKIKVTIHDREIDLISRDYNPIKVHLNKDGNDYIEYAPNSLIFYVVLKTNDVSSAYSSALSCMESCDADLVDIMNTSEDTLQIYFPSFDLYSKYQEAMLNLLSEKDYIQSIDVSYINIQSVGVEYPHYTVEYSNNAVPDYMIIHDYNEYLTFCESMSEEQRIALKDITEQTLENNYILVLSFGSSTAGYCYARCINSAVYITRNREKISGVILDTQDTYNAIAVDFVLVPKGELSIDITEEYAIRLSDNVIYIANE